MWFLERITLASFVERYLKFMPCFVFTSFGASRTGPGCLSPLAAFSSAVHLRLCFMCWSAVLILLFRQALFELAEQLCWFSASSSPSLGSSRQAL
jgi:hypothetical protein